MAEKPELLTAAEEAEFRAWVAKHFTATDIRTRLLATLDAARARIKELEAGLLWYSSLDDPEEAKKWHCVHQGDPRDKILSLWDLGHRARALLTKEPSDAE